MLQMPITPQCSVSVPPYRWRTVGLGLRLGNLFNRRCEAWGWRDSPGGSAATLAAFEDGRISVQMRRLPLAAVTEAQTARARRHGNESEEHARLKLAALLWMRSEGADDAELEARGIVGIADAYSEKANWIVECGNTRFSKLADAVLWEDAPRFTLIPYQNDDWEDGRPRRLIAIDFSWGKDLTKDLEEARYEGMRRAVMSLKVRALAPSAGRASA